MRLLDHSLYAQEKQLERDSLKRGVARYKKQVREAETRGDGASLKASERLLVHWFALYRKAIRKERRGCEERRAGVGRGIYGQYMRLLDTDKTAVIAMHTTLGVCLANPAGIHDTKVVLAIGRNLSAQMALARFHRKDREPWNALMHTDRKQIKPRGVLRVARKFFPEEVWPLRVQGKIGAMLLKMLLGIATVEEQGTHYPAFDYYKALVRRKRYYHIRLTQGADRVIRDGHTYRQVLFARHQPMVVKPLKWTPDDRGGYIVQDALLVKKARGYRAQDDLTPDAVLDAVNTISATPWRINAPVLETAEALRGQGGNVPGIPRQSDIEKPPMPPDFDTNEDAKKAWKKEVAQIHRKNMNLKGERTVAWQKFDIAERFQKYKRIYFPHDLDFRTRAYPVPLFLNHQGDDLCRGLLKFADARGAMEERARRWMLIHMANCCGQDKIGFDDRVAWVNSELGRMEKWADNPLKHDDWLKVDKPFQALACAQALVSPTAGAHLPVQIDGTCNALQHYAAMLRSPETAALVNLVPSDAPADAYADVADHTRRLVAQDAEAGNRYASKLEGWITRDVVKQTVMTNVYGVTAVGARRQIHEHLVKAGFEDDNLYAITRYLSHVLREALKNTCVAAHDAMVWLTRCASLIAKSGQPVRWRTPIGMRVVQPYRNASEFRIETILHRLTLHEICTDSPVHVTRQISGFAPNFVHSIDATHMMMTANRARDAGIAFAFVAVHDGFWTHAADMDALSSILREAFVELHREPLLDVLHGQLKDMYPAITFPPPPKTGTFDITQVLDSEYAFS